VRLGEGAGAGPLARRTGVQTLGSGIRTLRWTRWVRRMAQRRAPPKAYCLPLEQTEPIAS